MVWNTKSSRLRKVEQRLQQVGIDDNRALVDAALQREIVVAELGAAACIVNACGHDVAETAAGFTKLHAYPREEWPALFDEARASVRRTSSERDTQARLAVLEQLIETVQAL